LDAFFFTFLRQTPALGIFNYMQQNKWPVTNLCLKDGRKDTHMYRYSTENNSNAYFKESSTQIKKTMSITTVKCC